MKEYECPECADGVMRIAERVWGDKDSNIYKCYKCNEEEVQSVLENEGTIISSF